MDGEGRAEKLGPSAWDFNKQLLWGECGALLVSNAAAGSLAHFTRNAAAISATAVAGTLIGGSLFWLVVRHRDRSRTGPRAARELAGDIGYFTPAAIGLSVAAYDPAIYATSHYLLRRGTPVAWAVTTGQAAAFGLFVLGMNLYRISLRRLSGKRL